MSDEKEIILSRIEDEIQTLSFLGRMTYDYVNDYNIYVKDAIVKADAYILDLSKVEQIDSTGLGLLVNIAKQFMTNQDKMVMVITDPLIKELFVISKLNRVFKIFDSIDEAITVVEDINETFWNESPLY